VIGTSKTCVFLKKYSMDKDKSKGAGKGDKLRGGFSRGYRNNYDTINWGDTDKCVNVPDVKKDSRKSN